MNRAPIMDIDTEPAIFAHTWHGSSYEASPCQKCGGRWRHTSSGKCAQCIKARHKEVEAPLNQETVAIVRQIATEVCKATETPDLIVPVRILIASLFAGCRRNCIAASLGMKNAEVGVFTKRLFENHIWDWRTRVVPKAVQDAWVDAENGNMSIILDALVASGKIQRRGPRYFPVAKPQWKDRYEVELVQKLPAFDPKWSEPVQSAWFDSFRQLVERQIR